MPDVVGRQLDVAQSDIKRAGFEDEVEVVGGGTFGIIDESNWTVCEQLPAAGKAIAVDPRLTVDRSCDDGADQSTTQPPTTTAPTTSAPPTSAPTPTEAAPVTDAEVVAAFQSYVDERAAAGVVIAQAVTDVSFSDRVLRVTFDPAAKGIDQALFDQVNVFDNLGDFMSTPIAFNNDLGIRLRPAIDSIETMRADGTPLGTRTTAEVIELNELEE
jgi:hypothetical protein